LLYGILAPEKTSPATKASRQLRSIAGRVETGRGRACAAELRFQRFALESATEHPVVSFELL